MQTVMKEINDIKELRQEISRIKKAAGVKRGELSVRTLKSGFGLSVNITVKQSTPTAAAAVKAIVNLAHGDQEDDIMHDHFGSNHLSVYWGFEHRETNDLKAWYASDQDVEMIREVAKQDPDVIVEISDKTSARWYYEQDTTKDQKKGFIGLALYKTEGLERLTSFATYDNDRTGQSQIYMFASALARYRFIHEI